MLSLNLKYGTLLDKVNVFYHINFSLKRCFFSEERYRSLAPMYYRGAAAAIVVYDITKKVAKSKFISYPYIMNVFRYKDSFNGAKSWVKELQRRGDPNVVIALAGNKADMESKRKVQLEEAAQYALESDILHMETSAKTALNVRELFVQIGMLEI